VKKLTKKFLNSFRAGESGFTLIELLIVIAILGILAAVIIPNVSKFIGTSHVSAANAELAQVGTAAQAAAADQTGGVFLAPFMLDNTTLNATTGDAGSAAYNAEQLKTYITGSLKGAYWITVSGTVQEVNATTGGTPALPLAVASTAHAAAGTPGDPAFLNLAWDETTSQFVATVPGTDTGTAVCASVP
jgi:type IV pilus assembly protein PilA